MPYITRHNVQQHLKPLFAFVATFSFIFFFFFPCLVLSRVTREQDEDVVYEGNQQWEGYSMDLIDAISKILHFQYRFELVPDGKYVARVGRKSSCESKIFFLFSSTPERQVRIVQQSHKAMGRAGEAFIRSSESLTEYCVFAIPLVPGRVVARANDKGEADEKSIWMFAKKKHIPTFSCL